MLSPIDLQLVCWKTAFLLAIASVKQVSDLSALFVDAACLVFGNGNRMVHLLPNTAFQPEVLAGNFVSKPLVLEAFYPPLRASAEAERLQNLCPERSLRFSVDQTRSTKLRQTLCDVQR